MFITDLITARVEWKPEKEAQLKITTHASGAKTIPIAGLLKEKKDEIERAAKIVATRHSNSEPSAD